MKQAKILYFVEGVAPTAEDFEAANEMQANVVFRNAMAVPSEPHSLEICDGVAGAVPPIYAEAFPDAEVAIADKQKSLKALSDKVGDEPAPKPLTKKQIKAAEDEQKKLDAAKLAQTPNTTPATATGPATNGSSGAPAWNPAANINTQTQE